MEWRRQGASSGKAPGVPGSLHSWLGLQLRWERGSSSILPSSPSPLHSSRQAATGLLLHDCPLHGVPETLLPAAIFKIPPAQPRSLSPCSECSGVYRIVPATSSTKQAGTQVPGIHGQRWTSSQGVAQCPSEPSEARALAHPLRAWLKLGSGMPAVPRQIGHTHIQIHRVGLGMPGHVLYCQNLAAPTSALTPSLPHQSPLPTGWADSWARPAPVAPQGTRGRQEIDPLNFLRL